MIMVFLVFLLLQDHIKGIYPSKRPVMRGNIGDNTGTVMAAFIFIRQE
jgi:hypothetical protein